MHRLRGLLRKGPGDMRFMMWCGLGAMWEEEGRTRSSHGPFMFVLVVKSVKSEVKISTRAGTPVLMAKERRRDAVTSAVSRGHLDTVPSEGFPYMGGPLIKFESLVRKANLQSLSGVMGVCLASVDAHPRFQTVQCLRFPRSSSLGARV